ncbi:MAG: alpha/beta fold hydrolase [Oligoflexia bacterium]|nr:alpha/beta fold hydrolase [Oligoflexia bacterium]
MNIHFETTLTKKEDAPWVILINGLFANLNSWDQIVDELSLEFNILRYDCRGQGQSFKPDCPYLLADHVDDLARIVNKLDLEKFFLVGISNGGRIAMQYSKKFQQKVIAQVIADSYDKIDIELEEKLKTWKQANLLGGNELRFEVTTPWIFGKTFIAKNQALLTYFKEMAKKNDVKVVDNLISGALKTNILLDKEKTRSLVLVGIEDILTPMEIQQRIQSGYVNSQLKKVPGGHASLLENPQIFTNEIIPFFKDCI